MSQPFFYRFDGMDLVPGNKTAGFVLQVDTSTMAALAKLEVTSDRLAALVQRARERIIRAGLLSKRAVGSAGIGFLKNTGCPRFFVADPMFGGSIGADPETFSRLHQHDVLDWVGPTVDFTPHNVDTPKTALALMLLAQTWAEWAAEELSARAKELAGIPTLVPIEPEDTALMTLQEFDDAERCQAITNDDGDGYYATELGYSREHAVWRDRPNWATHVAWFNK